MRGAIGSRRSRPERRATSLTALCGFTPPATIYRSIKTGSQSAHGPGPTSQRESARCSMGPAMQGRTNLVRVTRPAVLDRVNDFWSSGVLRSLTRKERWSCTGADLGFRRSAYRYPESDSLSEGYGVEAAAECWARLERQRRGRPHCGRHPQARRRPSAGQSRGRRDARRLDEVGRAEPHAHHPALQSRPLLVSVVRGS